MASWCTWACSPPPRRRRCASRDRQRGRRRRSEQQRRRHCRPQPHRRLLPLRRARDAQRRLLGGGEAAQVHLLATVPHPRLVGLGLAGLDELHAEVARRVVGHAQRQPFRLRLLRRLLARRCYWLLRPPLSLGHRRLLLGAIQPSAKPHLAALTRQSVRLVATQSLLC